MLVVLTLSAFVVLNIFTAQLYPPVNVDEVMFTDPAVNLAFGHGFRSSAWYTQPYESVFASNAPLYSLLLAGWVRVLGFSVITVRSLNFFIMATAAATFWFIARRERLIGGARGRILLLGALLLGEGQALAYRMGRYDALGILILAVAWLAIATLRDRPRARLVALFSLGAMITCAGYQNMVYLALLTPLFAVWLGRRFVTANLVPLLFGCALGFVGLGVVFHAVDASGYFLGSLRHHSSAGLTLTARGWNALHAVLKDHSSLALLLAALLAVCTGADTSTRHRRRYAVFALLALTAIPATLGAVWKFQDYYTWMKYIPALFFLLATVDAWGASVRRSRMIVVLVGVACLGFPARVGLAVLDADAWRHQRIEDFVSGHLMADDRAVISCEAYYPTKRMLKSLFLVTNLPFLSPAQREAISVVVARPDAGENAIRTLGGEWLRIAELPPAPHRLHVGFGWPGYHLAVWRLARESVDIDRDVFAEQREVFVQ